MIPQSKVNEIVQNRVAEIKTSLTTDFDTKLSAMNEQITELTAQRTAEQNKSMTDKETAAAALKTAETALASVEEYKAIAEKKDEELKVSALNADDTQALISAGFGPEGAELLLGKLVDTRQVVDGKTFYKSGDSLADRDTIIGGLKEQFKGLITVNRADGHKVATKATQVNAGKMDTLNALLAKGEKRSHAENIQMSKLANEIKKDNQGD